MKTEVTKPQTKKAKVLQIVVNVFLVLVLLFGVFCSYTAFVSKKGNGVPNVFGLRIFSIQSDSMEDTFYEGDLIVDAGVKDIKKLEVGDVITFFTIIKGERALNTHRIKDIKDNGTYTSFVTQGDNEDQEDYMEVHENEVVGRYLFRIPALGSVIDFLQTSVGFLIVIVLPVFLFFVYNLVQFFRVFFSYKMEKMRLQLQNEMGGDASKGKPEEDSTPADNTPQDPKGQ